MKGQPLVLKLHLTSKDLYTGTTVDFIVNKRVECPQCTNGYESHKLKIPAGTRNGEEFTIQEGFNEYQNAEASDLVFKVFEIPSPGFERNGLNLIYRMQIPLKEALTGFQRDFINLDGQQISVTNQTEVTQHGQFIRVQRKGYSDPRTGAKGDLIVKVNIEMPRHLTPQALKELAGYF